MLTIAWDVDDVLNDLMRSWFEQQWSSEHPECLLRYDDIKENPPNELLGVSRTEYLHSLDKFRLSQRFQDMQPIPEVMEWFLEHGTFFRHIVVTATPLIAAPASSSWVLRHFGEWIRTFHFIPSYRQDKQIPKYDESKADFLSWFDKADILIDDNEANIKSALELGLKGILFPRPWNNCKSSIAEQFKKLEI